MNNQELELKIKEIINLTNFFDMISAAKQFEKEYKDSDFYKLTKMPIYEVIKESKIFYTFNIQELLEKLQYAINNLDVEHLEGLLDKIGDTFGLENTEIRNALAQFKDLQ